VFFVFPLQDSLGFTAFSRCFTKCTFAPGSQLMFLFFTPLSFMVLLILAVSWNDGWDLDRVSNFGECIKKIGK
jgi:hypothetical protein